MAKLTIVEGGTQSVYEIFEDQHEVSIGRGAANAVQVHDSHASKHHAAVRRVGGRLKLVDLESKNGTRVNGSFKNQHWLSNGDVLAIGEAEMRVEGLELEAASAVAAAPAAPAAPAPRVPAPRAPAAPAVRAPAPAPAAAHAAAPAPAPTRRAAAPAAARRRRDEYDDYDDYGDHDERPRRRRADNNSAVIVLLGGLGAIAFLFLMFTAFSGSGDINQDVRVKATEMWNKDDIEGAIAYAEKYGDPAEPHWDTLKEEVDSWKRQIAMRPIMKREAEARSWYKKNLLERTYTQAFRSKDALTPKESVEVLREFLAMYGDTQPAREILHAKHSPFSEYREWMKEYASDQIKPAAVMAPLGREIDTLVNRKLYGDAVRKLETAKDMQQLLMTRELAQEFRRMADARILTVKQSARRDFDAEMARIDGLARRGEKSKALRALTKIIDTYGLKNLTDEAEAKFDEIR
ncbi:MAG: FHA domain-containing protein [Planctomycetota bacterium]|nr:FHA domain-containing protein [Planctomycetota bacterium]